MDEQHQVTEAGMASVLQTLGCRRDDLLKVCNVHVPSPCRAAISKDPFYEMLASRKKKVSTLKGL